LKPWWVALLVAATGCSLIIGDRRPHGGADMAQTDGLIPVDGPLASSPCLVRSTTTLVGTPTLDGRDYVAIASVGSPYDFAVAYVFGDRLYAALLRDLGTGTLKTLGPSPVYTCASGCSLPRVSQSRPGDPLVFGVLDGTTPQLVVTAPDLTPPSPSPTPLVACAGATSFDVLSFSDSTEQLSICGGTLQANGNHSGARAIATNDVVEVRGLGGSEPSLFAYTAVSNSVFFGTVSLLGTSSAVFSANVPGAGAVGLGFDALGDQLLVAASTVQNRVWLAVTRLGGNLDGYVEIDSTETPSLHAPVAVAGRPSGPLHPLPLFLVGYVRSPTPLLQLQPVDTRASLLGEPLTPTQLTAHQPQLAYHAASDTFALTWIGPLVNTDQNDSIHVGFVSCP
jgi:hypothetical protein